MLQVFLILLRFLALLGFGFGTLVMLYLALKMRDAGEKNHKAYTILSIVFAVITFILWNIDLSGSESSDRNDTSAAFQSNFGFPPPPSVEEINVKNFFLHDASVHWMRFTYDEAVWNQILRHDQPLDTAERGSAFYGERMIELRQSLTNAPGWWNLPSIDVPFIFYKKNFLNHSFSDYHLWADPKKRLVYLQVSYFD